MSSAFKVSAGSIIFANGLTGILVSILNCLQSHLIFTNMVTRMWVSTFNFLQSYLNFCRQGYRHAGFGS